MQTEKRIPVIVGVGEYRDKPANPREGLEPVDILQKSVEQADASAGGGWISKIDCLRVVNQISWPYRDLSGLLAKRLRMRHPETIYGPVGGESPVRMLVDAALDIAEGRSEVSLLCGAEALKTAMSYRMAGEKPAWTDEDTEAVLPSAEKYVSRHAALYGLLNPTEVYPLYENAMRAAKGQSFEDMQSQTAWLWAQMSAVAADNPAAWSGKRLSEQDIMTASKQNRRVSFPYTKFMVAQIAVNQGAAILLTHRDAALGMGVAEDRLVYVGSGSGADEPQDFLQRANFTQAPALNETLKQTLALNNLAASDIDHFEFYSCFPCVPKQALDALGLPIQTPVSVTGGLSYFGGPGNNYMTHAIAAMTRKLRSSPTGSLGLLHGNGEFVTKHHTCVLSSKPFDTPLCNQNLQAQLDASQAPAPKLLDDYSGPCVVESFSVTYDAKGNSKRATVVARTPDGDRVLGRVTEAQQEELGYLVNPEHQPIGAEGVIYDGNDGWLHWGLTVPDSLPVPAVLFEKLSPHIALITLNRPNKRNSVDGAVTRLMCRYVEQVEEDPEIKVAILIGAGGKAFSAGADLSVATSSPEDLTLGGNGFGGFVNAKRSKPWIAAVSGFALGGGTEFTLACDIAVAGESAQFGLPEVRLGLLAAAGGAYRLARAIPTRVAMEYALTGKTMGAKEAEALSLVNRVVPDSSVLDVAIGLAEEIAAHPEASIRETLQLMQQSHDRGDSELSYLSMQAAIRLMSKRDFHERPKAFLDTKKDRCTEDHATPAEKSNKS